MRKRLLGALLTVLAGVLALFSAGVYLLVRESIRTDLDQFVLDKALILARQANPANVAWVDYNDREWRSIRLVPVAQTFDTQWQVAFVSSRLPAPIPASDELKRAATHPSGVVFHETRDALGREYRAATVHIRRNDQLLGYAQIGVESAERNRPLNRLVFWLAGGSLAGWLGAWIAARSLLEQWRLPLAMLGDSAERLKVGTLGRERLFVPQGEPELARLGQAFNQLLDALEASHAARQQFIANASHEIRTPLTIMRGEVEVVLRRPRAAEDYRAALESVREEVERLSRLSENLLTLARADAREGVPEGQSMDLAEVCREVAGRLAGTAATRRVLISVLTPESIVVPGDPVAAGQVVFNLVDNAIRHSPAGESVVLRLDEEGAHARLAVVDSGEGIPAEHVPRVFERFYRVDRGRSRRSGGAGLGLAIVKALVDAHHGRVEVTSRVGEGTTFTVWWPRGESAS